MPSLQEHWLRHTQTVRSSYPFLTDAEEGPVQRVFNVQGQLHSEIGPAYRSKTHCVWWLNGRKHGPMVDKWGSIVYYFRNVIVPPKYWKEPENLTVLEILTHPNAEVRYVGLEIYGFQRMLDEEHFEIVHEDDETGAKLLKYDLVEALRKIRKEPKEPEDNRRRVELEPLMVVCVINSTPEPDGHYKRYFLNVPPTMTTCAQAIAWTFGKEDPKDYHPEQQT